MRSRENADNVTASAVMGIANTPHKFSAGLCRARARSRRPIAEARRPARLTATARPRRDRSGRRTVPDVRGSVTATAQGRGTDLVRTRTVTRGAEAALFGLIRNGIPGTDMPPQPDLEDTGIWQIVTYLRALALPGQQPPLKGDPDAGRRVFRQAGCVSCHVVDGTGGFLGPPLDSISVRKTSEQIRIDVLDPDATLAEGFETVIAESPDGRTIEGILKNEDTFNLVLQAASGDFVTLRRDQLRSVTKPDRSQMPADLGTSLSAEDLGNLLAFLDRQRDRFVPVRRGFANY